MPSRTMDADEDTKVDTEPFWIRCTTICTAIIAREFTDLSNDVLDALYCILID